MNRLTLSLALGLLLAASLVIKVYGRAGADAAADSPGDDDIVALLHKHGFEIQQAPPDTDPAWLHGSRDGCRIDIADVSPQGWHRSIVEWHAAGKTLEYSAMGKLHDRQPILMPMMAHYLARLERYVGIEAPGVKVRAIVVEPECPPGVISAAELAALSD